ncbi:MAG: hypothetical protein AAGA75_06610 [Cyanobacteria bacterium P01_E01_bin.6]
MENVPNNFAKLHNFWEWRSPFAEMTRLEAIARFIHFLIDF